MADDIVTRLRERAEERMEASENYWQGHKFDYDIPYIENQAADEIERLRTLAHNLYEETKRCGTTHDTQATWDYEQWLEDND